MVKLGFNVHGYNVSNPLELLQWVKDNKPQTMLVLNNKDLATQIADLGVPYVILRMTNNDDSVHNKLRSFQEWWNAVKANYTDKRLIVHFGNEPKGNYDKLSQFSIEGMNTLYKEGHHGIFGNFAVGNPEIQDWKTALKPMTDALAAFKGFHYLGLHEYWMHSIFLSEPFEISRYRELLKLYPKNTFRIIFTEYGTDFVQDIKIHNAMIPDTSGYKDYNDDKYVFDQIKESFIKYYNQDAEVLGLCYFSYGDSGGWSKYNADHYKYLLDHVGELMSEIKLDVGATTIVSTGTSTNRRTGAGTDFPVKGSVGNTPIVVTQLNVLGDWIQFRFADGDYWVNKNFVTVGATKGTITLTVYDAPDSDVEALKTALVSLQGLLGKYRVEFS